MISNNGFHNKKHEHEISEETPYPEKIRPASTLIYYLLVGNQYSAIHRVKSDEIWHFYLGSPVTIHIINEDRISPRIQLGNNLENGENIHYVVTKGYLVLCRNKQQDIICTDGLYCFSGI